jgi:tRNA-binding protein
MRIGQIIECRDFARARKPAYQLKIDFGKEIGTKTSSAQITVRYTKEALIGRKIVAVVNFPPKKIANFTSEVLVLGVEDKEGAIVLLEPENSSEAVLGSKVY